MSFFEFDYTIDFFVELISGCLFALLVYNPAHAIVVVLVVHAYNKRINKRLLR